MNRIATGVVLAAAVLTFTGCPMDIFNQSPVLSFGSAAVVDGAHGGNERFFFLPPIAPTPDVGDEFDPSLPVVVTVVGPDGEIAETFSAEGTPASQSVRVSETDELYIVNWHTPKLSVADGIGFYTISVFDSPGGERLGYAEIELLPHGLHKSGVDQDNRIEVRAGSTLPIKFWIAKKTINTIPEARNVSVSVNLAVGVGQYDFIDDGPEGASTYQWYRTVHPDLDAVPIPGATSLSLDFLSIGDAAGGGMFFAFEVTPVDATGLVGEPARSPWVRPGIFMNGQAFLVAFTNTTPDQVLIAQPVMATETSIEAYYSYGVPIADSYNGTIVPSASNRLVIHGVRDSSGRLYVVMVLDTPGDGSAASIDLDLAGFGLAGSGADFVVSDDPGDAAWSSWDPVTETASLSITTNGDTDGAAFGPIPEDRDVTLLLTAGDAISGVNVIEVFTSVSGFVYNVAWPLFSGAQLRFDFPASP